jgi:4-amino-4-deoxy-L-arabinose transferase-like glycosyltransferase
MECREVIRRTWERVKARWRAMGSPNTRRALLVVLVLAFVLRVGWVAYAGVRPSFVSDPSAYLLQGETIARGQGYSDPIVEIANEARRAHHQPVEPSVPASFYPPGYSVFVGAVVWTVWHTPIPDTDLVRAVAYLQALLGTITVLLAFEIARRAFDARVGLLAAVIVAFYPNLVTTTATLQLETFFVFLTLATFLVLLPIATRTRPTVRRLVVGGALVGVVALVRPTIALVVVALLAARLLARLPWRETLRAVGIVTLAMVVALVPWMIRNEIRLHAFVPISTGIGITLCVSRNDEATGKLDTGIMTRQCQPRGHYSDPAAFQVATNTYATRRAIDWVLAHPQRELRMWFRRTDIAFSHDTSGIGDIQESMSAGMLHLLENSSDVASYIVLALGAIGVVAAIRRRTRGRLFVVMTALALSSVPIILYGDPRYRVPAEPFFAILAAAGVAAVLPLGRPFISLSSARNASSQQASVT